MRALAALALACAMAGCATARPALFQPPSLAQMQGTPGRMIVVAVANPAEPIAPRAGSTPRGYDAAPRYSVSAAARGALHGVMQSYDLREVAAWPIAPLALHCAVLEIPPSASRDAVLRELSRDPRVRLAQPLQTFDTLAQSYNDPYFGLQRGFAAIEAAGAQQWSQGRGVRVAVIDTGVDASHPDLKGRVALQRNFVDQDAQRFREDRHGTAVAGVIAAVANNREGIVGVAPEVELLALKACWQRDGVEGAQCNSFTLAEALSTAIETGADVINLSLAGPADPLLAALVTHALAQGAIVVGAVPRDGDEHGFPNGVAGVIAVDSEAAAHEAAGALLAPGSEILTLVPGGHYDFASGSSLAAAHVTGTIALLLRESPRLTSAGARQLLRQTSLPLRDGRRSVNACAALLSLRSDGSCVTTVSAPLPASGTR